MARPRKDATTDDTPEQSGVVLPRNVGWIDENGAHRWLAAGARLDPVNDADLIAFLMRRGLLRIE